MTASTLDRIQPIERLPGGAHVLDWIATSRKAQSWPLGEWFVWLLLGGRGSGKTRAAVEALISRVFQGSTRRSALVARTSADGRDVLVEGESGIMAKAPNDFRPVYEPSKRRLTWPNGALSTLYSADEPDLLRGPQHDFAVVDELATWAHVDAWSNLLLGLRLGQDPRVIVATTPRPTPLIRQLAKDGRTVISAMTTYDNLANLSPTFAAQVLEQYEGTRLGRQELHGEILSDIEGALWRQEWIDADRVAKPLQKRWLEDNNWSYADDLTKITVGVDPTGTETGDEVGIVVAGLGPDKHGYVLADRSGGHMSPEAWGRRVVEAYVDYQADEIVGEGNFGGDMVLSVIRQAARDMGVHVKVDKVTASRGKRARAEPIAQLYEQHRIHHVGVLAKLENELTTWTPGENLWTPGEGTWSPNRLDALVWALSRMMPTGVRHLRYVA